MEFPKIILSLVSPLKTVGYTDQKPKPEYGKNQHPANVERNQP